MENPWCGWKNIYLTCLPCVVGAVGVSRDGYPVFLDESFLVECREAISQGRAAALSPHSSGAIRRGLSERLHHVLHRSMRVLGPSDPLRCVSVKGTEGDVGCKALPRPWPDR